MQSIIASIMALIASLTGGFPAGLSSSLPGAPAAHAPAKPAANTGAKISAQQAFDIAYKHAGVNAASTFDRDAELDRERGRLVWEIEFETRTMEYDYDIDATTGAIIRFDHDRD